MPINLSKGQKVSLTKGNPGLKKILVGLGWDVNAFDSGADFDLDASAFLTNAHQRKNLFSMETWSIQVEQLSIWVITLQEKARGMMSRLKLILA